ncbi:MAG: site-specific integrase, partial [Microthrixaceae bacterium]
MIGTTDEAPRGSELPIEAEGYLTHLLVERGRSARTLEAYRSDLIRYTDFVVAGGGDVLAAGPAAAQQWATELRRQG